ncbi:MAG: 2-oxoacid ferredoxin oxidoreductase [Candidatus Aenigmarchaeota archaeon]|nr:2-oxoacid ferredoxin oxidoreductase [Candidatus Aenigmarchaeota archaeon]
MASVKDLTAKEQPTWCPGCADFGILTVLRMAVAELGLEPHNTLLVSGIGCGSKTPHFVRTYGFEGLHGRILPVATGAKLVNKDLTVIAIGGDGDGYGIGGNHFLHTMRRNLDMTYLVQDNEVYGLTKGQASPTSPQGFRSPSTPSGALEEAVNPISLAIIAGATYVARGYAFNIPHLKMLIMNAVKHKGFALIDILQPCPTYNKANTMAWYNQRVYKLEDSGHNASDKAAALAKAEEWGDKIPIGLFYKAEKPTYEDGLPQASVPPVKHDISSIDIKPILARMM